MSAISKVDVVGVGLNATDTLIPVHHYAAAGSKVEFRSANVLPAGARLPQIQLNWPAALALSAASLTTISQFPCR
jgi:hypothetical protein